MSHIIEFEVEGLAGRTGLYRQRMNRHVNMFFGVNGSGKTSLLKILHSAMSGDASLLTHVPVKGARVVVYSQTHDAQLTYVLSKAKQVEAQSRIPLVFGRRSEEFSEIDEQPSSVATADWTLVDNTANIKTKGWKHEYLPTTRLLYLSRSLRPDTVSYPVVIDPALVDRELDAQFEAVLTAYWARFFGDIQTGVRQLQQQALVDILNEVLTTKHSEGDSEEVLDWEMAYDEMVSFLRRQNPHAKPSSRTAFKNQYHSSVLLRKVIARIDRVERELENSMAPKTKLQNLVARLFNKNKTVTFGETSIDVRDGTETSIGLGALSAGEKHILYILVQCLSADGSSIIIDEPEISMHVDWQRELIPAMRELNPDAQIIAATHSPEILACIPDESIFSI